jgi:hypothetical protein
VTLAGPSAPRNLTAPALVAPGRYHHGVEAEPFDRDVELAVHREQRTARSRFPMPQRSRRMRGCEEQETNCSVPDPLEEMAAILPDCCARAASGYAAAPPTNVTNSRRRMYRPGPENA